MKPTLDPLLGALAGNDWFPSPAHILRRAAVLNQFAEYPPGRLLEVGCGAGRLLIDWDHIGHHGWGVDLDRTARIRAADCVAAFGADFQIDKRVPDEKFDYLVALEVIEHLPSPMEVLEMWSRSLNSGGIFLASVPAFRRLWGKSDEWAGHVCRFERDELKQLVEGSGFEIVSISTYGYPLGNLIRVIGNVASGFRMQSTSQPGGSREAATLASGHDRAVELKASGIIKSKMGRFLLKIACTLQAFHMNHDRGTGFIVVAKKR